MTFYFQTDINGNFLVEGIPGGQFICEGKDPTSNKTSSPVEVAVDQTAPEPSTAELILPLEETPAPEPQLAAEKTQPLAYTGTNLQKPIAIASTLLVLGFIMVGFTAFKKRKRENETEEN